MDKALLEAVSQSLILMEAARLKSYGAKVDADMVQLWASDLSAAGIDAEIVKRASNWFRRCGDGEFPSLPVFVKKAIEIRGVTHDQIGLPVLGEDGEVYIRVETVPVGSRHPVPRDISAGRQASAALPQRVRELPPLMDEAATAAEFRRQMDALRRESLAEGVEVV